MSVNCFSLEKDQGPITLCKPLSYVFVFSVLPLAMVLDIMAKEYSQSASGSADTPCFTSFLATFSDYTEFEVYILCKAPVEVNKTDT